MKVFLILLFILFFNTSYAINLENVFKSEALMEICNSAIYNQNVKLDLKGPYFSNGDQFLISAVRSNTGVWNIYKVNPFGERKFLKTYTEEISAVKIFNNEVYVLRSEYIDVLSVDQARIIRTIKTHSYSFSVNGDYRAFDFDIKNNLIYVAHGGVGVTVIEQSTGRFVNTQDLGLSEQFGGQESKVIAIQVNDQSSVVTVAPITPAADGFAAINGLIKFNTNNFDGIKIGKYHSSQSAISDSARLALNNGTIFLSNKGFQESVKEIQLNFGGLIFPTKKKLSITHNDKEFSVEIIGDFFKVGKKTYACGRIKQGSEYKSVVIN